MQNPPPDQQDYRTPYNTPPAGAPLTTSPAGAQGKTGMGLDANVAGLLCYVLTWLTGLVFFFMEKENRFVRFHAMQAILFGASVTVIAIVLNIIVGILAYVSSILALLGGLIWLLFAAAFLIGWVMCMVKAYQGQIFKLPVIGDIAYNIVNK